MKCDNSLKNYHQLATILLDESEPDEALSFATRTTRSRAQLQSSNNDLIEKRLSEAFNTILDLTSSEMSRRFKENSEVLIALDSVFEFDRQSLMPLQSVGIKIPDENDLKFVKKFYGTAKAKSEDNNFNFLQEIAPLESTFPDTCHLFEVVGTFHISIELLYRNELV